MLQPVRCLATELADLPPGFRLITFDEIDSTNTEALRRIDSGDAAAGDVFVSKRQSAGRGRRGREWVSVSGNLHMTVVVDVPSARPVGELAFVASLAARDGTGDAGIRLKWPNDLMRDGRKLGGILIETVDDLAAIGIGINIAETPQDVSLPATRLSDRTADALVGPICEALDAWYTKWRKEGFATIREAWLASAMGLGQNVTANLPTRTIAGRFVELDEAGALCVEKADGTIERVTAGDVFFGEADS